jgi:hypothetical protein
MEKRLFEVCCPENGDDSFMGIYRAFSEEDIFIFLCKDSYGEEYTDKQLKNTKSTFIVSEFWGITEI